MDLINNLALGFGVAYTLNNLMYAFFGCVLGTPVSYTHLTLPTICSV